MINMGYRTKITVAFVGVLMLFWLVISVVVIDNMKNQISGAVTEKAKSDLATALEIVDYMSPGPWQVKEGVLYKGATRINENVEIVDKIANLTNDTVTIFLDDTRVATNVTRDGKRAIGTKAADYVSEIVLSNGKMYTGEAEVVGVKYQTCYVPLKNIDGEVIGMFYVGVSKEFADQLHRNFTAVAVLSARIAILFVLAATCFIPVDSWASSSFLAKPKACRIATNRPPH